MASWRLRRLAGVALSRRVAVAVAAAGAAGAADFGVFAGVS